MKKLALDFALALAVIGGTVAVSIPERNASLVYRFAWVWMVSDLGRA